MAPAEGGRRSLGMRAAPVGFLLLGLFAPGFAEEKAGAPAVADARPESGPEAGSQARPASGPVYKPLSVGALSEFGMLQSGRFGTNTSPFRDEWIDHLGAFVTQEVETGKLSLRIGIGGIFQVQKPQERGAQWPNSTQNKAFFIGPTVADFTYATALGGGTWSAGAGMFPYKYNAQASNLGEYLFRTGPYPTFIWSGGYAFVNDNHAVLQGFRTGYTRGGWSADLLLTTETVFSPLYDLSLAGVTRYALGDGLLELIGGVNFKRLLPVRPSRTERRTVNNSYFRKNGKDYAGKAGYYADQAGFYKGLADLAQADADKAAAEGRTADAAAFQAVATLNRAKQAPLQADADSVKSWLEGPEASRPALKYYTQAGTLLMAGFTFDPKKLLGGAGILGPEDLKISVEAALLGVTDYPVFYASKADRIPVTLGFNFPGFRILDRISLQAEYFDSPWINSYGQSLENNEATPSMPRSNDYQSSRKDYMDISARDNFSWSVLATKEVLKGLKVSAQFARDHIRNVSSATWVGPGTDPNEMLQTSEDWYWMLQFSVGI